VANTATYVLDDKMRPVKGGEVGELYIASKNLAMGYVGDQVKEYD
jgi:non-ribosomal peptide synthetase component F